MSVGSYESLFDLYVRLGEAQARLTRSAESADAYALALYYARRLGNAELAEECRALIAKQNPNHIAGREVVDPLLFAHLLVRYPAEQVESLVVQLESLPAALVPSAAPAQQRARTSQPAARVSSPAAAPQPAPAGLFRPAPWVTTTQTSQVAVDYGGFGGKPGVSRPQPAAPVAIAPISTAAEATDYDPWPGDEEAEAPAAEEVSAVAVVEEEIEDHEPENFTEEEIVEQESVVADEDYPSFDSTVGFDLHHTPEPMSRGRSVSASTRVVEDVLAKQMDSTESYGAASGFASFVNGVGMVLSMIGILALGFFSYELYPAVADVGVGRIVDTLVYGPSRTPLEAPEMPTEPDVQWASDTESTEEHADHVEYDKSTRSAQLKLGLAPDANREPR